MDLSMVVACLREVRTLLRPAEWAVDGFGTPGAQSLRSASTPSSGR